jgi:pimeloyl-ACP methyl ester carboxylesterase
VNHRALAWSAAAAAAAVVAAPVLSRRRWMREDDQTGGEPLGLPEGVEHTAEAPDGARLAVLDCGPRSGRVIVAVHGWTADRRVWGPVARRLVDAGRRVVVYDQRGHGASTVGSSGCTMEAIADDLRAVLEHLDLRDAVVAGHSMGGMAVEEFAVLHKDALAERVSALVLVSTESRGTFHNRYATGAAYRVVTSPVTQRALESGRVGPFLVRSSAGRRPVWSHLVATRESFASSAPEVRGAFMRAMSGLDITEGLAGISVPVVVVAGTRDTLTRYAHNRCIALAIPGARLETIHGAGHQLMFEAPDRLAAILTELSTPGTTS